MESLCGRRGSGVRRLQLYNAWLYPHSCHILCCTDSKLTILCIMHKSLIHKLDTSGPVGIDPFVRQSKLESCLHRFAFSEWVRGGLILMVPSQLIVDVTQFLVLNWRSQSSRLWQRLFHHVFAVQKDEFPETQRCQKLAYCA